jgi:hypothetical protein
VVDIFLRNLRLPPASGCELEVLVEVSQDAVHNNQPVDYLVEENVPPALAIQDFLMGSEEEAIGQVGEEVGLVREVVVEIGTTNQPSEIGPVEMAVLGSDGAVAVAHRYHWVLDPEILMDDVVGPFL